VGRARGRFQPLNNQHLQKCVKTNDFIFFRMNTCEKPRGESNCIKAAF
jgi:hypothetical protein